jgi:hypothetical protein
LIKYASIQNASRVVGMMEIVGLKRLVSTECVRTLALCMVLVDIMLYARPSIMTEYAHVLLDTLEIHTLCVLEHLYYLNVHLIEIVLLARFVKTNVVFLAVEPMPTVLMMKHAYMDTVNVFVILAELVDKVLTAHLFHTSHIAAVLQI